MKKFISILLSIALTILIPILIFLFCTSSYLKVDSLKKVINNIEKEKFTEEFNRALLYNEKDHSKFENAINESGLMQEIMAISLGKVGEYVQTGKVEDLITQEEYNTLIDTYFDDIIKETKENMTEEKKKELKQELQDKYIEIKEEMPSLDELANEKDTFFVEPIRKLCNKSLRYTLLMITILILLLLIVLQRKRWNFTLYISIPATIGSIGTIAFSNICKMLIEEILQKQGGNINNLIKPIFINYVNQIQKIGILLCIVSIFSIVLFIIFRKRKK